MAPFARRSVGGLVVDVGNVSWGVAMRVHKRGKIQEVEASRLICRSRINWLPRLFVSAGCSAHADRASGFHRAGNRPGATWWCFEETRARLQSWPPQCR